MASTSKNISVEDAVSYLLADNDSDLLDSEFELSDDSSDENGENENENMNENMRKKISTRGGSNAVLRRTHKLRTKGGRINNSTGAEERDKILEESWSKVDREPQVHNFNGQTGLQVPFSKSSPRILDYFKLFATSDFYQMISDQTNLYAEQHFQSNPDDKSRSSWAPTTATEIRHFLALYFLTRIVQKPQIRQYWSTDPLLQALVSNHVMTRNRFQKILQFLHFADNSHYDAANPGRDKLFKVILILQSF